MKIVKRIIKKAIKNFMVFCNCGSLLRPPLISGINIDYTRRQPHVLVCYLDFLWSLKSSTIENTHTNIQEMLQIIHVLIDLGFVIDVCSCNNLDAFLKIKENYYDVIFGFGETFREAVCKNPMAIKIEYFTENPYFISHKQETERIDYLRMRKGINIALDRTGAFYHKDDEVIADGIICLCDGSYFKSLKSPVTRIYPSGFINREFNNDQSERNSKKFLVLGTAGFVHKGNDLLIEVFAKHSDWTLYMCGNGISKTVKKLHYKMPNNVIDCGFLKTDSEKFITLAKSSTFIISPSCSEGISTGVLTGMRHGLIPIVTKGNGFDIFKEYCLFFDGFHIEEIEAAISTAINMKQEDIHNMSNAIYDFANAQFTLTKFTDDFKTAFSTMVNQISGINL